LCAALGHTAGAGIVVYGHSHVLMVYRHEEVLLINPGAIAPPAPISRQVIRTVALLYFDRGGIPLVTHMDVDNPSQPFDARWWLLLARGERAGRRGRREVVVTEVGGWSIWYWRCKRRAHPAPCVVGGQERSARDASNQKARHHLGWQLLYPSWRDGFVRQVQE
jgi:hypothetical protein